jgi:hypothetical protein
MSKAATAKKATPPAPGPRRKRRPALPAKKATLPAPTPGDQLMKPHQLVLSPSIQSTVAIKSWGTFAGDIDLAGLLTDLRERIKSVQDGDMKPVEAMLIGQAMALETLFTSLTRRASSQEYVANMQTYLSLALKAQAQCRATLEALAEIKNPRQVSIVKQANISGGHQQINNGQGESPREISGTVQNGLLGAPHGIELDTRAPSAAGVNDQHLEAVGAVHRTTDTGR